MNRLTTPPGDNGQDVAAEPKTEDLFDLNALRVSQNFGETRGVRQLLTTVPVRKPNKQHFIRVHPDEDQRIVTAVLEYRENCGQDVYLVAPAMRDALAEESKPMHLFLAIDRSNTAFLWPIGTADASGRMNAWHKSALDAAQIAMNSWVRVVPNHSLQGY